MKSISYLFLLGALVFIHSLIYCQNSRSSPNNNIEYYTPDKYNSLKSAHQNLEEAYWISHYIYDTVSEFKFPISLKHTLYWHLASIPQKQIETGMFPEATTDAGLASGFNRAWLSWYIIDPLFYDETGNLRPLNIDLNELSDHFVRLVLETEVFPNKSFPGMFPTNHPILNLVFYPTERGPYNYDVEGLPGISPGISEDGKLNNPESRWGGIMRGLEVTDWEEVNVQYIEFWLMDPFVNGQETGGDLYINIGDISEDVLMDAKMLYENGLPASATSQDFEPTIWGRVPTLPPAYDNFYGGNREYQDVGYDGLRDEDEFAFYSGEYLTYLDQAFGTNSQAYLQAYADPSNDNYHYFRGSDYDEDPVYSSILERYKRFSGPDGNSPTNDQNPEPYPIASTYMPDVEDFNRDGIMSEDENYYQYKITLDPDSMQIGTSFLSDIMRAFVRLPNGMVEDVNWYYFSIPINEYSKVVGDIEGFNDIRFIRMFVKNFTEPTVFRLATLDMVRVINNPDVFDINVFPNPVSNSFWVDFEQIVLKQFEISLRNHSGNLVYQKTYFSDIYKKVSVDVSHLETGMYFFVFKTRTFQISKKIIVIN
jgi:cell surface protein SprA